MGPHLVLPRPQQGATHARPLPRHDREVGARILQRPAPRQQLPPEPLSPPHQRHGLPVHVGSRRLVGNGV